MLQLSSSYRQSTDIAGPRPRRRRRLAAWIVAAVAVAIVIAGGLWTAHRTGSPRRTVRLDITAPPPPLPALKQGFLPLAPARAEEINAGIPLSTAPIEPARPFVLPAATTASLVMRQSAVDCLTAAIYYEAAGEGQTGERAVAQVVLNRVRHPAFPKSVCGVVYEGSERSTGCQFSFTCDGSLARKPSQAGWDRAREVALAALAGYVERSVGTATHYHTRWVVPYWAWSLDKIAVVGAHIFYRWKGYWGRRSAFTGVYAGETAGEEQAPLFPLGAEDGTPVAEASSAPPGPRPLADNIGRLGAGPSPAQPTTVPLRADQQRGTLAADEQAGTLIHTATEASEEPH
jgi:hypothetical protein